MRTLAYIFIIALLTFTSCNREPEVTPTELPKWVPQEQRQDPPEYYYFPNIEVYYHVPTGFYYYHDHGHWKHSAAFPSIYGHVNLYSSPKVKLSFTFVEPYHYHHRIKWLHPGHGQHKFFKPGKGQGNPNKWFKHNGGNGNDHFKRGGNKGKKNFKPGKGKGKK